MKRKLPEKFFEQNQRAKTRKWKFFNLNQALWGAGNREFRFISWRLCRDSNPDLTLRRGLFYPVELQRRTVLKLSVFASECLSGPQL